MTQRHFIGEPAVSTPSRPTTVLLVIIAVLLAAHLAVLSGNEVHAQVPDHPGPPTTEPQEPRVVGITVTMDPGINDVRYLYRLWSDGVVEQNIFVNGSYSGCNCWSGWQVVPE